MQNPIKMPLAKLHPAKHQAKTLDPKSELRGKHKKPTEIYTLEEANDRLYDVFRNHDFHLISHEERKQLAHYYRLLMLNQEKEKI